MIHKTLSRPGAGVDRASPRRVTTRSRAANGCSHAWTCNHTRTDRSLLKGPSERMRVVVVAPERRHSPVCCRMSDRHRRLQVHFVMSGGTGVLDLPQPQGSWRRRRKPRVSSGWAAESDRLARSLFEALLRLSSRQDRTRIPRRRRRRHPNGLRLGCQGPPRPGNRLGLCQVPNPPPVQEPTPAL